MAYTENYQKWLDFAELPDYLHEGLVAMDEKTKEDAFYASLEFDTAGIRGIVGAGINRISIYVVRQATEGLAKLIETKGEDVKKRGVTIAYDSRHFSPEFAFKSAQVLAKHGIKAYIFELLRPTPKLSFAVRHLGTFAGIMVTAGHNLAPFNGYKVYGEDGGQVPPADADALTDSIRAIENPFAIKLVNLGESKASGLIKVIGGAVDAEYLKEVKNVNINQKSIDEYDKDMRIVYTPPHGTGEMLACRVLARAGFDSVQVVEAQVAPDPDFSTVKSPNPENQGVFVLAEKPGRKVDADVPVATDPDADRLDVEIRRADGSYRNLSGNQIGAIIVKYILEVHRIAGTLSEGVALAKSAVSTELVTKIAESYGVIMFNVLTGFKLIVEKIQELEEKYNHTYMLSFEESFDYLIRPFVRGKGAVQVVLIVAKIATYCRSRGSTLADGIEEIYKEYGYFAEKTISVTLSGVDGAAEIKKVMDKFRDNAPTQFNTTDIAKTEDFLAQTVTSADGVEKLTTPPSNVLKYTLADDSWIAVRPPGTEPKIKLYIATVGIDLADAGAEIANIEKEINDFVK